MTLHGRRLGVDELAKDDIDRWSSLQANATTTRTPFLTYGFARAVHDTRGGTAVAVLEEANRTVGYFPFQYIRRHTLPGAAEKIGGHMSDFFDIAGSKARGFGGGETLRAAGLSALRFDHLPAEMSSFCLGETVSGSGMRVTLADFASYAATLAKTQSKFASSIQRGERQMKTDFGDIAFSWQTSDTATELERLIAIKREQYARTGTGDALAPTWTRALFSRLFEGETKDLQPVLSTLYAGSTWVSTCLCLGYLDTLHVWFPVYNAELRRYSPGNVLFLKLFEHGANAGYRTFDFGEGVADYKRRFLSEEYELLQGANRRASLLGLFDRVSQSVEWRLRALRQPKNTADD